MIQRFLGKKTKLLNPIINIVKDYCSPGDLVCDIFSGSLSVSLELKKHGYRVASNDINLFSAVIGDAFLVNNEIPEVEVNEIVPVRKVQNLKMEASSWAENLLGSEGYSFLIKQENRSRYENVLVALRFLLELEFNDLPKKYRRTDFYDTYTTEGENSGYVSLRGKKGNRQYFSGVNGIAIDTIINQIRFWKDKSLIDNTTYAILVSVLLRAVEKISNTQGTYHDFPRNNYDPRALKPLILEAPRMDVALSSNYSHILGREEDSLEFIKRIPKHKLIYIDPPYNFRQYTSYYFMLNLISRYSEIDDFNEYFANVKFVRGQNMEYDFKSTFNGKNSFLDSLHQLISRAKTKMIVLSYFDGKNHWNDFKSKGNGKGYKNLMDLFSTDSFIPKSLKVIPVPRMNYQSYGGYKGKEVHEYLFIAEKRGDK